MDNARMRVATEGGANGAPSGVDVQVVGEVVLTNRAESTTDVGPEFLVFPLPPPGGERQDTPAASRWGRTRCASPRGRCWAPEPVLAPGGIRGMRRSPRRACRSQGIAPLTPAPIRRPVGRQGGWRSRQTPWRWPVDRYVEGPVGRATRAGPSSRWGGSPRCLRSGKRRKHPGDRRQQSRDRLWLRPGFQRVFS
jgi:hypothetical protein